MKRILVIGPQGSGKSTLRRHLAPWFDAPALCSGELVREEMRRGTEFGIRVQAKMDAGELLTDAEIEPIIFQHLEQARSTGWILDGYPRRVSQAETLLLRFGCDAVIHLTISDEECIDRLANRLVCSCGRTYHPQLLPPLVENQCDSDGLELTRRDDDRPEIIRRRLEAYHRETEPVIPFLRERKVPIAELRPVGDVYDVLKNLLWRLGQTLNPPTTKEK